MNAMIQRSKTPSLLSGVTRQRARIMRHRARLEEWSLSFSIEIETSILAESEVKTMLDDSGRRAGIGDFRPAKGGPFGRFTVVHWEEIK